MAQKYAGASDKCREVIAEFPGVLKQTESVTLEHGPDGTVVVRFTQFKFLGRGDYETGFVQVKMTRIGTLISAEGRKSSYEASRMFITERNPNNRMERDQ